MLDHDSEKGAPMTTNDDLREECVAFALATGMVDLDNSQAGIEKAARRARHARRRGSRALKGM